MDASFIRCSRNARLYLVALIGAAATVWITGLKVKDTNATTEKLQQNAALGGPIGSVVAYAGDLSDPPKQLPPGWKLCDGSVFSKDKYPELYRSLNGAWGGDQENGRLPDLQGYFLRGVDNGKGRDPDVATRAPSHETAKMGNVVGTTQADALKDHSHLVSNLYVYYMLQRWPQKNEGIIGGVLDGENKNGALVGRLSTSGVTAQGPTGKETRPKNASVYWIIRVSYESAETNGSTKP